MTIDREWWKEAIVYQIYPRSFNDSDGDGIGDLPGITRKLDYVADLGTDVVWLNPVYDSPNADNGYDIRDYRSIMDEFGTMAEFDQLLEEVHERDMRLIMDLVVNHTSDEHEWFRQSRRREGPYEDYYYWRDGEDDEPPNNWRSFFGGPAWTYDDERGQYYLHLFHKKQPDLNWRNPDVRADIYGMMTWWFEKNIDGFRMDVINLLSKAEGLPDGRVPSHGPVPRGGEHFVNGPRIHEYLSEMHDRVLSQYDCMTVGEMIGVTAEDAAEYLGDSGVGLHMAIHFEHVALDVGAHRLEPASWTVTDLKAVFDRWQRVMAEDGWNALYFENHDQPRVVSRLGDKSNRRESATMIATLLLTLRGTPYVYQGQELGMTNADFESLEEIDDAATVGFVREAMAAGEIESFEEARDQVNQRSRDHARTPMQWSDAHAAGFTDGDPWLKINDNYTEINVEASEADADSILQYYRDLIDLRHRSDVLVYGSYDPLVLDHDCIFAYRRTLGDDQLLVVLNWADDQTRLDLSDAVDTTTETLVLSNIDDAGATLADLTLAPYEARIYRLQ